LIKLQLALEGVAGQVSQCVTWGEACIIVVCVAALELEGEIVVAVVELWSSEWL